MICVLKRKNIEGSFKHRKCQNCNGDKKDCFINYYTRNAELSQPARSGGWGSPTRPGWVDAAFKVVKDSLQGGQAQEELKQIIDFNEIHVTDKELSEIESLFEK
jgi:hypothetical protein